MTKKLSADEYAKIHLETHRTICRIFGKHELDPSDAALIVMLVAVSILKHDFNCTMEEATTAAGLILQDIAREMKKQEGGFAE